MICDINEQFRLTINSNKMLKIYFLVIALIWTNVTFSQCAVNGVYINAFLVDPSGSSNFDTDGSGSINEEDEFIQICNGSGSNVNISGWTITEGGGGAFEFDATNGPTGNRITNSVSTIASGECYTILRGLNGGTLRTNMLDWGYSSGVLNNSGTETITLSDGTSSCVLSITTSNWTAGCASVVSGSGSGTADCSLTPSDLGSTPLPVELLQFGASTESENVHLKWSTASELNNDYFEIEKSMEGIVFESIGKVKGAGTSQHIIQYSFIDALSFPISYYRLKQVDFDGTFTYSDVIKVFDKQEFVRFGSNENKVSITSLDSENDSEYLVMSINGILIDRNMFYGETEISTHFLSLGIYFITVFQGGKAYNYRFVK